MVAPSTQGGQKEQRTDRPPERGPQLETWSHSQEKGLRREAAGCRGHSELLVNITHRILWGSLPLITVEPPCN